MSTIKGYLFYVADINIEYQSLALAVSHIPSFRKPTTDKECLDNTALKLILEDPKKNKTVNTGVQTAGTFFTGLMTVSVAGFGIVEVLKRRNK